LRNFKTHIISILFLLFSTSAFSQDNSILNWVGCGISKKSYLTKLAAAYTASKNIAIDIQGGGATRGIRDVATNTADFGGSCRFHLPDSELESKTGFEPVAWDALAIITHKDNPVSNVTLDQVKQIYTGKITSWSQLGGADRPIKLLVRKGKISGVGYSIRSIVFSNIKMEFAAYEKYKSSGPLEKAVEKDIDTIAITGVSSARLRNVKILTLNNKFPDYTAIKSGHYALYRPLYITFNPKSEKLDQIKDFIKFAHSRKGRRIMIKNGVVPYLDALRLVMIQSRANLAAQKNSTENLTY